MQNLRSLSSTFPLLYLVKRKAALAPESACGISGYLSNFFINRKYFVAMLTIHVEDCKKVLQVQTCCGKNVS